MGCDIHLKLEKRKNKQDILYTHEFPSRWNNNRGNQRNA